MRRYASPYQNTEGGISKILGIIFVLFGIYAILDLYGIFSIETISNSYIILGCAIAAILGGLYMVGRSGRNHYRY